MIENEAVMGESYMFFEWALLFLIYAFLGWCTEVAYNALTRGKFINAGILNGPWCPIYGFGILAILWLLKPFEENLLVLFFGAVGITSALELITGIVLEKLFHQKWWDYSDRPFNLGGYICLLFSLGWGLGSLILVERIHPRVMRLMAVMSPSLIMILAGVLLLLLVSDAVVTGNTILKLNRKLDHLEELSVHIRRTSQEMGEALASGFIYLADRKEDMEDRLEEKRQELRDYMESTREYHYRLNDGTLSAPDSTDPVHSQTDAKDNQFIEPVSAETVNQVDELISRPLFGEHRLFRAFPHARSKRHPAALQKLKEIHLSRTKARRQHPQTGRFRKHPPYEQGGPHA